MLNNNDTQSSSATLHSPCSKNPVNPIFEIYDPSNVQKKKVLYFGVACCVLFAAYNTAISYVTSLFPTYGNYALGTVNLCNCLGSLLAPSIGDRIGQKKAMLLGATMFVMYLLMLQVDNSYLLLAVSVINGICTASFWINQGRWMQKMISPENLGTLNGLFWMLYNSSSLIGNTASLLLTKFTTISSHLLVWCLAGVAIVGAIMILFMSDAPKTNDSGTTLGRCKKLLRLKDHRASLLLAPYSIGMGVSGAFNYGCIPAFLILELHNSSTSSISQNFILYGLGATAGSFIFGKVFDKYGWKVDLLSNLGSLCAVTLLSFLLSLDKIPESAIPICLAILLFFGGLNDAVSNCVINISVSKVYLEELSASGWTCFRVFFCVGYSGFMFSSPSFSFRSAIFISFALQLLGIISYYFFGRLCFTDKSAEEEEVNTRHVSFDTLVLDPSEKADCKVTVQSASGISRSVSVAEFRGDVAAHNESIV